MYKKSDNLEKRTIFPKLELKPLGCNIIINIGTQQEYDQLMQVYEVGDWLWGGWGLGHNDYHPSLPTSKNHWHEYKEYFGVTGGGFFSTIKNQVFFGFLDVRDINPPDDELISLLEFYNKQKITYKTLEEINKWFEVNRPNRASKIL